MKKIKLMTLIASLLTISSISVFAQDNNLIDTELSPDALDIFNENDYELMDEENSDDIINSEIDNNSSIDYQNVTNTNTTSSTNTNSTNNITSSTNQKANNNNQTILVVDKRTSPRQNPSSNEKTSGMIISINLGLIPSIIYDYDDDNYIFNTALSVQMGYLFGLGNRIGISLLAELGYNFSVYGSEYKTSYSSMKIATYVNGIVLGILPEFNIGRFSIGLGAGVKIPINGFSYVENSLNAAYYNITAKRITDDIDVTPYVKIVPKYSLFIDNRTAVTFAFPLGYDFEVGDDTYKASPESFYVGFQVGLSLGPRL